VLALYLEEGTCMIGWGGHRGWDSRMLTALLLTATLNGISPSAAMRDTTPGAPVGVPFARNEYVRAQLQVRSREEAEALARGLFASPELIGAHLMDGDLLLLALLSDELAARVIARQPSLRAQVEALRGDPQRTQRILERWRAAAAGDAPPPS
jgi:hypothetical protein